MQIITLSDGVGNRLGLSGEVDSSNAQRLRAALQIKLKEEHPLLVLDCRQLTYLDSCGMAALVEYARDAKEFGGDLRLVNLSPNLESIFRMVRLHTLVQIGGPAEEDKEAAS